MRFKYTLNEKKRIFFLPNLVFFKTVDNDSIIIENGQDFFLFFWAI